MDKLQEGRVKWDLKKKKLDPWGCQQTAAAAVATGMQWESPGRGHWSAAAFANPELPSLFPIRRLS